MLLYSFLLDTDLIAKLKNQWQILIYDSGFNILKKLKPNRKSVVEVVASILDLKIYTDAVVDHCFNGNIVLRNAQITSFQEFLNLNGKQA